MKQEIRKKHLEKRKKLSAQTIEEKSKKITKLAINSAEFQNAKTIMAFVGVKKEPQTQSIIEEALALGKTVCVPAADFEKNEIVPVKIKSLKELETKKFGLLEPKTKEKEISIAEIDLVLVPGVAFDLQGNRVGYGKGFFDRFLKKTKANAIGLCFEQHLEKKLPAESHDKKVKKIITEKRALEC